MVDRVCHCGLGLPLTIEWWILRVQCELFFLSISSIFSVWCNHHISYCWSLTDLCWFTTFDLFRRLRTGRSPPPITKEKINAAVSGGSVSPPSTFPSNLWDTCSIYYLVPVGYFLGPSSVSRSGFPKLKTIKNHMLDHVPRALMRRQPTSKLSNSYIMIQTVPFSLGVLQWSRLSRNKFLIKLSNVLGKAQLESIRCLNWFLNYVDHCKKVFDARLELEVCGEPAFASLSSLTSFMEPAPQLTDSTLSIPFPLLLRNNCN